MQLKQPNLSFIFLAIILTFFTVDASAQFPGMSRVSTYVNNQFIDQQMRMNMTMGMMNTGSAMRLKYSSRVPGESNEYNYLVKMKDGTEKTVKSYIYIDTTVHKSYLLFVDKSVPKTDTVHRKQKIYVDQTVSIGRIYTVVDTSQNNVTLHFTGMATDSCWLFDALPGKISLYSFVSEFGESAIFDASTVAAIQYDKGPIVHLNTDELKRFIAADEKAMKLFDKKYYLAAIEKFNKDSETQ
jgi:hypothetical protein